MIIRKAFENDVQDIQVLIFRNIDEVMSKMHSQKILDEIEMHTTIDNLSSQLSWKKVYIVEDKNRIVGTGSLANFGTKDHPKYSVSNLFVTPELHRKGIGTLLIKQLIGDANEKKATEIHVPSSRTGIDFYKKFGFNIDKEQPEIQNEITWMTKSLKPTY